MSFDNSLRYLQQLLTMVNPKDKYSIALARTALFNTMMLAKASDKADPMTLHAMHS